MANADLSWVGPYWLERQSDPTSPDFVPGTDAIDAVNLTHRNGTLVGNLGSRDRALVDPRGLVTPLATPWSVDWWVGAEDRWHLPSRAPVVRQRLVGAAPVVETALRVPGGDSIARVYGMHSTVVGACAVIEIENRTAVPFALAIAVRPYNPLGPAPIDSITLDDASVMVNGRPALLFPKAPARTSLSNASRGDAADVLFAGGATASTTAEVHCDDARATAVFVFPLAHTAVLRVVLPLASPAPVRRGRSRAVAAVGYPDVVPSAEQVAKGWEVQTRRGLQFELPDQRLTDAVDAARRHLLLAHGGEDLVSWPDPTFDFAAAAAVLQALDLYGFHDEAAEVLGTWSDRQALDGTFVGTPDRIDANAAALAAVARHWRLTADTELIDRLIGPLAKGAHWIEKRRTTRRAPKDGRVVGLLPVGSGPDYGGPRGAYFRDAALSVRALADLADALAAGGQPDVAADARRFASALRTELDAAIHTAATAASRGRGDGQVGALPATPSRRLDPGIVANLELAMPFGPYGPAEPAVAATLDLVREQLLAGDAVVQAIGPAGLSPALTMLLATVELEAGDRRALGRLGWMLDAGGPTVTWPTAIHPQTGGGSAGQPHDAVATARFLTFVRHLLVREVPADDRRDATPAGLAFCSLVPAAWLGQSIDVREAPTAFGLCSFSLRWHGDRPALLWEVEPHPGLTAIRLTAPGLDASWSSTEWKGEALLAPVPVPAPEPDSAPETDSKATPDAASESARPGSGASGLRSTPPSVPFDLFAAATESPIDLRRPIKSGPAPVEPPRDPTSDPTDAGGSFT